MGFFRRKPHGKDVPLPPSYHGIYLGEAAGGAAGTRLRYKNANLHITTFGAPGAAKSAGLLVPNISHLSQSMIVIDPKGALAAITARKRATMGKVIMLNPLDLFADELPHLESHGWPSLLQLDPARNFAQDAACIADAIMTKSTGGGSNRFFDISGERLVTLFIMRERLRNPARPSLRNVVAALSEPSVFNKAGEPIAGLALALKQMTDSDVFAVRAMASRLYARLTDKNSQQTALQDVIDTALKDFAFLNDDRVAFDMARGKAIDWGALHREVTTIYLILPVQDLDPQGMGKWLRIFINLALRGLYQNPPTHDATLPRVLFMLDEFAALGRLQEIPKALGVARDYSIALWFVLQNMSQLKTHYPDEWPLWFTGSGAVNSFRCADLDTAEYLSKTIGNTERYVPTQSADGRKSETPHAIPLIRPEDLMRLPPRMTVNLINPCPLPILAHVPIYVDTPWAAGLDPNPYYRK